MAENLAGSMSLRDYVESKGATSQHKIIECVNQETGEVFKQVGFFIDKEYEEGERNQYVFLSFSKGLSRDHQLTESFLNEYARELRVVETTSTSGRVSATMYLPGDGSRTSKLQNLAW